MIEVKEYIMMLDGRGVYGVFADNPEQARERIEGSREVSRRKVAMARWREQGRPVRLSRGGRVHRE